MKRFISIIVAAYAFFAASAQFPMVTLSHNGELSFFTNTGAFKSAYDAAENGDILYLSEGNFIVDGGSMTISKRLNVVGTGYGSHILGDLTINLGSTNFAMDAPLFDGVRLDKLHFSSIYVDNLGETEIRRCWIRELVNGGYAGKDITYDKCYIESADFSGSGNIVVQNSKLRTASSGGSFYNNTSVIF